LILGAEETFILLEQYTKVVMASILWPSEVAVLQFFC
jgi:hypothetical protein